MGTFIFPPHLTNATALPGETESRNCVFSLKHWMLLANKHRKHIQSVTA